MTDRAAHTPSNIELLDKVMDDNDRLRERVKELELAVTVALEYVSSEAVGTAQQEIEENERVRESLRAALSKSPK